ncbi:MAG: 16S rRNA (guanine(527)-N(7))-methyltransferase RsmG [Pseudonocardiales bacterium]
MFGRHLPVAQVYGASLANDGVLRGLIGPREVPRLWERHLLNCAVVAELIPEGAAVLDVGSGAGLPGIPLAIARPDLMVTLLEPLGRRSAFLEEMVRTLDLVHVRVVRGRAEEWGARPLVEVVTARAVAPLDRLVGWCVPLLLPGGRLLAIKGAAVQAEIHRAAGAIAKAGGRRAQVRSCGVGVLHRPATVVEVVKATGTAKGGGASNEPSSRSGRRTNREPSGMAGCRRGSA